MINELVLKEALVKIPSNDYFAYKVDENDVITLLVESISSDSIGSWLYKEGMSLEEFEATCSCTIMDQITNEANTRYSELRSFLSGRAWDLVFSDPIKYVFSLYKDNLNFDNVIELIDSIQALTERFKFIRNNDATISKFSERSKNVGCYALCTDLKESVMFGDKPYNKLMYEVRFLNKIGSLLYWDVTLNPNTDTINNYRKVLTYEGDLNSDEGKEFVTKMYDVLLASVDKEVLFDTLKEKLHLISLKKDVNHLVKIRIPHYFSRILELPLDKQFTYIRNYELGE